MKITNPIKFISKIFTYLTLIFVLLTVYIFIPYLTKHNIAVSPDYNRDLAKEYLADNHMKLNKSSWKILNKRYNDITNNFDYGLDYADGYAQNSADERFIADLLNQTKGTDLYFVYSYILAKVLYAQNKFNLSNFYLKKYLENKDDLDSNYLNMRELQFEFNLGKNFKNQKNWLFVKRQQYRLQFIVTAILLAFYIRFKLLPRFYHDFNLYQLKQYSNNKKFWKAYLFTLLFTSDFYTFKTQLSSQLKTRYELFKSMTAVKYKNHKRKKELKKKNLEIQKKELEGLGMVISDRLNQSTKTILNNEESKSFSDSTKSITKTMNVRKRNKDMDKINKDNDSLIDCIGYFMKYSFSKLF